MKKTYTTKEKYVTLGIAFLCAITLFACAAQDKAVKQPTTTTKTEQKQATKQPVPTTPANESTYTWTYAGEKGPTHWGDLSKDFAACKNGASQSPISLSDSQVKSGAKADKVEWQFRPTLLTLQKQGPLLQAVPTSSSSKQEPVNKIKIGNTTYSLQNVQFHMPSEHVIQGNTYPMEMEWIYQTKTGERVSLSVFAKEGKENPAINGMVAGLAKVTDKQSQAIPQAVSVLGLFPFAQPTYYEYQGSLTTPPCSENIKWIVYEHPIELSKKQLDAFQRLAVNTNRPIQSDKGRTILKQAE